MESNKELLCRHFALVDASYCFVAKHRAFPTVRSVLRVANSFGSSQLTRQDLVELCAVAPELLILEHDIFSSTPVSEEDVEVVTFPLVPQTSERASTKRKKLFDAALKKTQNVDKNHLQGSSKKSDATTIDDEEDVEVVTFPLVPQTSERASTKRKKLFDAALKKTQNVDKNHLQGSSKKSDATTVSSSIGTKRTKRSTSSQQVQDQNDWRSSVLTMLQKMDIYKNQIVHVERCHARQARYRDPRPLQLSKQVCDALEKCYGIQQLYSHQFDAIEAIRRGENVVLSTATASGKSLAYNVPMLDMLIEDPSATFLYLFPTKALAQDQLKSLR
ncbi:Hypothetical protein PHPALM_36720, partial [Phytophthora palmivora]